MAETAAHLADHVLPRLPVRQWVLSLPERLRYHLQHDREALNSALRICAGHPGAHRRARHPARIASARGPPEGDDDLAEYAIDADQRPLGNPLAQPEPEYEYDQRVTG